MVDITENADGTLISYGSNIRVERQMVENARWTVYRRVVVSGGLHPLTGRATTVSEVWEPIGGGTEQQARDMAEALAT